MNYFIITEMKIFRLYKKHSHFKQKNILNVQYEYREFICTRKK